MPDSRPLKILQLNSARKYIGEAAHTLNLTESLRLRGHKVWLGLRKNFETVERAAARGLDPIGFHMPHRWWPPQDGRDIRHIANLVRENKIDLIHAHRGKDHWQAVFAVRLYRLGIPVIRTRHVVTPLSGNTANRWLARRTAVLVVVSKAVEQDVSRTGMYSGERIIFIPGGIDLKLFKPATPTEKAAARARLRDAGCPTDGMLAMCVARFAVVKAHKVLLNAWKLIQENQPTTKQTLVLVGDGLLMEESRALAGSLGIASSVVFVGKRHDVPELLDAADVGVLSSVGSEGFSRAVLEYIAKGLPTVGTRVGAVPDLISDGVHGALVRPGDAAALAEGLSRVFSADASQRAQWGAAARDKAEQGYGYESWAEAHERLYAKVLDAAQSNPKK